MEYRQSGNSDLQFSTIDLGTNNFGRRLDAEGTARVMNQALEDRSRNNQRSSKIKKAARLSRSPLH
jgi:aryl-alcohol dehydrogenase-like predicted oxidoreductase